MSEKHIDEVHAQLLAIIPETETELIHAVKKYDKDLWNKAPELRNNPEFWKALELALNQNVGEIDAPWKEQLVKIFNGTI